MFPVCLSAGVSYSLAFRLSGLAKKRAALFETKNQRRFTSLRIRGSSVGQRWHCVDFLPGRKGRKRKLSTFPLSSLCLHLPRPFSLSLLPVSLFCHLSVSVSFSPVPCLPLSLYLKFGCAFGVIFLFASFILSEAIFSDSEPLLPRGSFCWIQLLLFLSYLCPFASAIYSHFLVSVLAPNGATKLQKPVSNSFFGARVQRNPDRRDFKN